MKTMIVSDFATLRPTLVQLVGICTVVALFMGYATGAVASGAAAVAAMTPFMLLFSLAAIDEQGGWERFRLPLGSFEVQNELFHFMFKSFDSVI